MLEQPDFTKHGTILITNKLVNLVSSHDWTPKHLWNQDICFKGTQCIFYDFSETFHSRYAQAYFQNLYKQEYNIADMMLRNETQYILDYIIELFPGHRFIKGEISHCPPGEQQGFHIDPRVFHRFSRRVHVPLITNLESSLKVLYKKQHLAQGEIWTFNNLSPHASENLGNTSRVHIVVDIMEQEIFNKIVSKYPVSYLYHETSKQNITI